MTTVMVRTPYRSPDMGTVNIKDGRAMYIVH